MCDIIFRDFIQELYTSLYTYVYMYKLIYDIHTDWIKQYYVFIIIYIVYTFGTTHVIRL